MQTSAMLKTEFNNTGKIITHFSGNINVPNITSGSQQPNLSDLIVVALLSNNYLAWDERYQMIENAAGVLKDRTVLSIETIAPYVAGMMYLTSSNKTIGHSDTVSMVAFTDADIRKKLTDTFKELAPDTYDRAQTIPIEQLLDLMVNELDFPVGDAEIVKNPTLTISRVTNAEFSIVESQYVDSPPFVDAFDMVKDLVVRQEAYLNSKGYMPAVYTSGSGDGYNDTIVFKSGCALVSYDSTGDSPPL